MEMLNGYEKKGARLDTRLPFAVSILEQLCTCCALVLDTEYTACLFTAFYAFMRIGELTTCTSKQAPDVMQLSQVTKLSHTNGFVASVKLTFYQFKHHYNAPPLSIAISHQPGVCPVETLMSYFSLCGLVPGPLFY